MSTIEEKRDFRRIIKIQVVVMEIIIAVGGIMYGINTGKWSTAFMTAIKLQSIMLLYAPMAYMAAVDRLEKYSDRANCRAREVHLERMLTNKII
jgi:uncharacterized membrane protein